MGLLRIRILWAYQLHTLIGTLRLLALSIHLRLLL